MKNSIQVRALTRNIGAEVHGVDLTQPLDDSTFDAIHDALMAHQVIFFRDQSITPEQHVQFGKRFGKLHIHPAAPVVDNRPELMRIHADATSKYAEGTEWHTDVSCDERPPMGSILHLTTVPSVGGDTLFSSMYAAFDALSDTMKEILDPMIGIHESEHVYAGKYDDVGGELRRDAFPSAEHPVIRTHPVTGRKALYVNSAFTTGIKGLSKKESAAILGFLFEHVKNPRFHCRFTWRENSVAFWDNRCVQHFAVWDYFPEVRSGIRVTVEGDKPFH